MATKAQEFRYWQQRSGPKKPPRARRERRGDAADTSQPGVSATDRRAAPRKPTDRAGKKAVFAFEESAGRPSRKSTRKAANRQKNDVQARLKRTTAEVRRRSGRPR